MVKTPKNRPENSTKIEVKNGAKNGANLGILKKVDFRRAFFDFVHNLFILFGHF